MSNHDYYKTLGVSRTASAEEIRKAYRKLARQYHPDVKPNDKAAAEKFKQIQEAYSVLRDPQKRRQFDEFGTALDQTHPGAGGKQYKYTWTGAGGQGPIDLDNLSDLFTGGVGFEQIFGGGFGRGTAGRQGRRSRSERRGDDIRMQIELPFQIAVQGGEREIQVSRNGRTERLSIKIPPGVENGSVIRLAGEGQPDPGRGQPGDLLLTVGVVPHPYFRRDKTDLILEVPITSTEATLGAKIEVPTLGEGNVLLTIPPGTSSGTKLRLRGKGGVDPKTGNRGDQFVTVKIVVPRQVSKRAQELLRELESAAPQSPRANIW